MNPVEVFISYSHRDERFLVGLSKHLAILKRQGLIRIWHDRKVPSGKNIDFEIDQNLEKSRLILLLVSSDFIASDYCYEKEMHKAMSMHAEGSAVVIPIIVRPVDWTAAPFSRLKALPRDAKPLSSWKNRDDAYLDIVSGIRFAIEGNQKPLENLPPTKSDDPRVFCYQGSVVQVGGVGSRLVTKTAWLIAEHGYLDAQQFITHSFNSGGDILWVSCPPDFVIEGATSPTGNEVLELAGGDNDTPYGIALKDQVQNTIVITCSRKEEEISFQPLSTGTICPECYEPMAPYQKYCAACGFAWPR